ncbi:MAG: hypothetical protein LBS90_02535, partial [Oscillospiraceae bacterium]|nr:hypothetical protein [Oscillospiraceae bacterium]
MDFLTATSEYYSHWLGADIDINAFSGVACFPARQRETVQPGDSERSDIYAWYQPGKLIISHSERASTRISEISG